MLTIMLSISILFLVVPSASAATIYDAEIQQEYQRLVAEGLMDSTVDYNSWATDYIKSLEYNEQVQEEIVNTATVSSVSGQTVYPAYTNMKAGDIFITTDSAANGVLGHSGIAISSTAILHMPGYGKTSEIISYGGWKARYDEKNTKTYIYRQDNTAMGQAAADWARKWYWNSNGGGTQTVFPAYHISPYTSSKNPSYCSKLVWQAYKNTSPSSINTPMYNVIHPYALQPTSPIGSLWNVKPRLIATVTTR